MEESNPRFSLKEATVKKTVALARFPSVFLNCPERKTRRLCPRVCPEHVCPTRVVRRSIQSPLAIAFSVTGDGLDGGRLQHFALARFRVTIFVSYTCRRAVRWPSGRRRRFAKPLYGLKPVSRVRIPASPPNLRSAKSPGPLRFARHENVRREEPARVRKSLPDSHGPELAR